MTQSFAFQEPGSDLLPRVNVMQTTAYNLIPSDGVMPGQKGRRASEVMLNDAAVGAGGSNFCDLFAAQPGLVIDKQDFLDRMIQSARSGRFPLTGAGGVSTYQPVDHEESLNAVDSSHVARYRSMAMANFYEGRRSSHLFHAYNGCESSHGFGAPRFGAFESSEALPPAFPDVREEVGVTSWGNLTCDTAMGDGSRSWFESAAVEPQRPTTPRGHQTVTLSDSHLEYLQHMERMQAQPESPHQGSTRGRRLAYGDHPIVQGEKHVHVYLDPVVDWSSSLPVGCGAERAEHGFEPPAMAPPPPAAPPPPPLPPPEPNMVGGEKFDLNEVPVSVGDAATPKPRKKYHPRVAKDKRTYKRRVDGKRAPGTPVDGLTNLNSPVKKAGKRSSQHVERREGIHAEVVDTDKECNGHAANAHHNTAVCDCEACIKLRLERRVPQTPSSPPHSHGWNSTSGSSPARRTLFQAPEPRLEQACPVTPTSCLQQFNESAALLGLAHRNLMHSLSSAIVPATAYSHNDRSLLSRLCPRDILSPQTVPFRHMNQVQRIVYLRSLLRSTHQLMMSPESLLRHVHDHLPQSEKHDFKEALWPIVVGELTAEQEKQLKDYAQVEQVGPCTAIEVVKPHKPKKPNKGRKSTGGAQNGLELVPYDNKSVVPYDGPFDPLQKKKKNRAKVVLDDETVRVWKLLMGKSGSEKMESDAERELKWEEERRKMKAQAQNFIERMHIVMGDRSFSKWKGSVVDSVVGAFLTQNVNDVLSSSAFMSMRSRFPGRGFRKDSKADTGPEEAGAQGFGSELQHPPPLAPSPCLQPQSSGILGPPPSAPQLDTGCGPALEPQESSNEECYEILAGTGSTDQGLELQCCRKEDSRTSSSGLTEELSTGIVSRETETTRDLATDSLPSHGKYNPKTGLTGLERAKIEEKQVSARKDFDFSGLPQEFKPRVAGQERLAAPQRSADTEDGVDWEAVRQADVAEVADVIKERGLNWILAGRIKAFLERIHLDYGALDLEWLRSMSTDQTKDFLLSIRGLGLKSVECIRLLTLHHLAFPVDTNVGRICVRLGWVPLEPLPEELQLHLLELYPVQATIQKYLWPRLCKFDHKTLYELHYQMISFGKVFCTKTKPNCNACPMRPECKHFASALSSAKLALPAPAQPTSSSTLALPPSSETAEEEEGASRPVSQYCQPIIEEPMTPEREVDMEDSDIEDYPFSVQELVDADEEEEDEEEEENASTVDILSPLINVTPPEAEAAPEPSPEASSGEDAGCRQGSHRSVIDITDGVEDSSVLVPTVASQEMVLVAPATASLPVPKLKNVGRLRTVHYVYELPDNHPLLDGLDLRESDDPCTYLLAIWGPGEVPESIPNMTDSAHEESGPFASSTDGEETIKATLLVPCRTAMRGSFPLNGTYFQVNEVFADHASSLQPMLVPRTLLWNLRRRFVFFGTSVISIFRGMTAAEIQACFWRGYVCVRGFDRTTRAPKPLVGRLHLQAGKAKGANLDV